MSGASVIKCCYAANLCSLVLPAATIASIKTTTKRKMTTSTVKTTKTTGTTREVTKTTAAAVSTTSTKVTATAPKKAAEAETIPLQVVFLVLIDVVLAVALIYLLNLV